MKMKYSKNNFIDLDFDSKCVIFEKLLTDDYFQGQADIGFYFPDDSNVGVGGKLPETPPEIKVIEEQKMNQLILKLTDKLFERADTIEFDFDADE